MNYLSDRIRTHRLSFGMTQEVLAEALGVSPQAISRWERGSALPDISLLPGLATLFKTTTDDLLGMDALRRESYLNDIFGRESTLRREGSLDEAIAILRDALRTYPDNTGLLSELALTLTARFEHTRERSDLAEAITISERLLASSTSDKVAVTTKVNLCYLYKIAAMPDRAANLAHTLPHIWESRELVISALTADAAALRNAAALALTVLCYHISRTESSRVDSIYANGIFPREDTDTMLAEIGEFLSQHQ